MALPHKDPTEWSPSYIALKEQLAKAPLSPRVRMALRMYVNAAVPTLKAAADAVGISYTHLTLMAKTPAGEEFMANAHEIMQNKAIETNVLIQQLGRRAVEVIGGMMEDASSDALRLKAAIDLADRAPETSKIQRHQVESFSLDGKDAKMIAEALAQGRSVKEQFAHLATENFDKVGTAIEAEQIALPPAIEPAPEAPSAQENKDE